MEPNDTIIRLFPNLHGDARFDVTSPETTDYNCIAWAAGDMTRWWWPLGRFSYWPPGVQRSESLSSFVDAYHSLGYEVCDDYIIDDGFEYIVIYVDAAGTPTHAARLTERSRWTSKLGEGWDISHGNPAGVEGGAYGIARQFMRRPRIDHW